MKLKFVYIFISVVAVAALVAITGVVYASPQTTVTPNCSGGGNNNGQQMNLQIDDQDQPWGNQISSTWMASNMAPGQTFDFIGSFAGLRTNVASTTQVTCDYQDTKAEPDHMAQKIELTRCIYVGNLWTIDCMTGNWQIFATNNHGLLTGNNTQWKLTDVDKDALITLYDLKNGPLNYLPLPNSNVTSSTEFQISAKFLSTAGNDLQSDSLNMNMYFTATSWDTSSNIGGISPALMQLFLGQSPAATSTCVTSSQNHSSFGQSVTFTATVSPVAASTTKPTGSLQFQIDGTNFGLPVSLTNGSANSGGISTLSVGNHVVTAVYGGDGNYSTSTGTLSGGQTVKPATKSTSTLVTSSNNPSYCGQSVTFAAKVTGAGGTPSGMVQFLIDGTNFGKAVTLSNGIATSGAITTLTVGIHAITAIYSGDSNFATSTGTLSGGQKVRCKTIITWPYKPNPCNFGQTCTFKVQIGEQSPGAGTPTGNVIFYDGSKSIGTCNLSGGTAILNCLLPAGSHNITATYNGDDNNDGSTSAVVNQTVNKDNSTIAISSSASLAKTGSQVTFTAMVGPNTATGTVTFKDGNTVIGTGTLKGGQASYSTSSLSKGTHSTTAVYGGDSSFNGSASSVLSQVIK